MLPATLSYLVLRPQACNFIKKETATKVFSCEYCKNFKNTFSHRTTPVGASVITFISSTVKLHLIL